MAMNPDLKPRGDTRSHRFRMSQMTGLRLGYGGMSYERFSDSPYFTPDATRETMDGTQFGDENHRRITPYVQELFSRYGSEEFMSTLDATVRRSGYYLNDYYDVVIVGSGPHGTAVAAYLREQRPDLTTLIIEKNEQIGGQWRSYGPKPVFQMNSRIRKADRRLPTLPRTEGSINPLGMFAPLELSDFPLGVYAWNTEMGQVCAVNAYLSADDILTETTVLQIAENFNEGRGTYGRELTVTSPQFGDQKIKCGIAIDATGVNFKSRIADFGKGEGPTGYFTGKTFYEHFAQHDSPLEIFHNQKVAVIGRGDSALTVLEALIGNLPTETYGHFGVGRYRPKRIDWLGAADNNPGGVISCLRSRYRNGIPQALRRDDTDESGMIVPIPVNARRVERAGSDFFFDLLRSDNTQMFPNVVIDCTTSGIPGKQSRSNYRPDYFVGPSADLVLPPRTQNKIQSLGIPENQVSLWATMSLTDSLAQNIADRLPVAEVKKKRR